MGGDRDGSAADTPPPLDAVGVVAIGRNEGERLIRCLESLPGGVAGVVYVDSGSTDGSVEAARARGVEVVALDMSIPFTAARARNEGIAALRAHRPGVGFVHVLDGDCEMEPGWLETALREIGTDEKIAVVCGQRREKRPGASVYNLICDIEWRGEPGDAAACGGDALIRLAAFDEVGGYDPSLIAGEEPEMCFRMRARGWRIRRLADTMTRHDAAMTRFGQWWRRCVRAGYAAAEGAWMHGRSPERYNIARCRTVLVWAVLVPVLVIAAGAVWFPWGFAAVGVYPLQWVRLVARERRRRPLREAMIYAGHLVLTKFPQLQGMMTFVVRRLLRREARLIEYKNAAGGGA